jgi:Pyruvate/2-oxoacid:ferredoxin oxidoreductase gamma subunit
MGKAGSTVTQECTKPLSAAKRLSPTNIILIGAAAGAGLLPVTEKKLEKAIIDYMSPERVEINKKAFRLGTEMVKDLTQT